MNHCAKCGAELIGSRKFCAACGTPAVDPRASPANAGAAGAYGGAPPASQVNPFAQTAMPGSAREKIDSMYGPPPTPVDPAASQVSPLAVSNAVEQRGAFSSRAGAQVSAAQEAQKARPPGTQMMPSAKSPSAIPSAKPAGTQLMNASELPRPAHPSSGIGSPLSSPAASTGEAPARIPGSVPRQAAQPQVVQPPVVQPPPAAPVPPPPVAAPVHAPVQPYAQPSYPANPAYPYAAQPIPSPVPFPAPAAPAFYPSYPSLAPGARVHVTWSNGQRYPGTVHQIAGHQCLVVFPDGQQHWVDMQYVAPA